MNTKTQLSPLHPKRAQELLHMLKSVQNDDSKGLALDDSGFVTGVVAIDDPRTEHLLGDLDVHA